MPSRFAQPLRAHSEEQLRNELESAHEELFTLRFQAATRQLADVSKIRKTRRQVARLRTLLHEHELGLNDDGEAAEPAAAATVGESPAEDEE
ncbi:MAG: 50S ribosomal protein L29 [Chloroflexi bacterium]|nr:50S ribosomal protein L29 [Chloroflexota bacterium]